MSLRTIARTASLAFAVTGALFAVAVSTLVQACGGESEAKKETLPADAASEGSPADAGSEEASDDAPLLIDAPVEATIVDVVPQDDVTLDVIPAE